MDAESDAGVFVGLAEALQAKSTTMETADEVVWYAQRELDADFASITLLRSQRGLETIAPSNGLAEQADALEYELGEGPEWDSSWRGQTLVSEDLTLEQRWPRWAAAVAKLGITSMLAAELTNIEGDRIGSLNLYWEHARTFNADDVAFADIFARHAAMALATSMEVAGLHTAMDGRKRIGQAQGLLMERYGLDENQAFEVLKRYSQNQNLKLRQVAEQLVVTRKLPDPDA